MPGGTRNRAMTESDLAEHVKKAVSPVETAPKQKHVRSCIVYAWDHRSSRDVWQALKSAGVLADQIPCFKALITVHKLLVLGEALGEIKFLEDCVKMQGSANLGFGYAPLIRAYVEYLKCKIEFHRVHPEFTGSFDYEEYLSLKGIADLNEGYETIMELMDLQGRLELFERHVLESTHGASHINECRISSLVPLIEESHGIYKFLTSMLSAMHLSVESPDPLVPLVERYNLLFWDLKRFYQEAGRLAYLTSLMQIPELPNEPPSFTDVIVERPVKKVEPLPPPPPPPVEVEKIPEPSISSVSSYDLLGDVLLENQQEKTAIDQLKGLQYGAHTATIQTVAVPVIDPRLQATIDQLQAENEQLRAQLQAASAHISGLEEALQQEQQFRADLQRQYDLREERNQEQRRVLEDHLKALRTETETWKARSDGMGKLYQGLREEHLALLASGHQKDSLLEQEKEQERLEKERLERERLERLEQERLERERLEKERLLEQERLERECLEQESLMDPSRELARLAEEVDEAANRFKGVASDLTKHIAFPAHLHEAILGGTADMTEALLALIRHAIAAQAEILAAEGDKSSQQEFYRKNSTWSNGLISAAQAIASATVLLVETANGTLLGTHTVEQLAVASNRVAAATAQLVTASRVKAVPRSKAQPLLEDAARAVSDANRILVQASSSAGLDESDIVVPQAETMSSFTVLDLNKHSELQQAEKKLEATRFQLADLRRRKYISGATEELGSVDVEEMNKQVEIKELEKRVAALKMEYDLLQKARPDLDESESLELLL